MTSSRSINTSPVQATATRPLSDRACSGVSSLDLCDNMEIPGQAESDVDTMLPPHGEGSLLAWSLSDDWLTPPVPACLSLICRSGHTECLVLL